MNHDFGRIPPQNIEAEKSVLGSMMIDADVVIDVLDILNPEDFYREENKEIFDVIRELSANLKPVDLITVFEKLKIRGTSEHVGGLEGLTEMANGVPTTANAMNYAKIVLEKSKLRKLIKIARNIIDTSYEGFEASEIIDAAERDVLSVNENSKTEYSHAANVALDAINELEQKMKNKGKITGLITGFTSLDFKLGGIQDQNLVLIAARPAMGKTSLSENITFFTSVIKKQPAVFFSLEMSKQSIVNRMFSGWGRIDNSKLKLGTLDDRDWVNIGKVYGDIAKSNLIIDDTPNIKLSEIRSKCRRIKKKYGDLRLVVVDHMTEMWRPRKEDKSEEYAENVRGLKRLAIELNCPVILLQQLNRECEKRTDKRPMLSDLKETGVSEEAADIVMFIYRDDYYNPETEKKNIAEVIISKNRFGATGTVELNWQGQYTKFSNIERYQQEQIKA